MLVLLLFFITGQSAWADGAPVNPDHEPIPYFERYRPSFFLIGPPLTKIQVSFKVQIVRDLPVYLGYTQLMLWDLFGVSAPFRDLNYNPEVFYRLALPSDSVRRDLDLGLEHESNGRDGPDSRSWDHAYLRYLQRINGPEKEFWWSVELGLPFGMDDDPSRALPTERGLWELQIGASNFFGHLFEVNELILRVYGGGSSRINPVYGGQELTYREKTSRRAFLLPLYFQIFHGYGEYLLGAADDHWGLRAGVGF